MTTAELRSWILSDAVMMGLRATVGVVFIVHGMGKFDSPFFVGMLTDMGIPFMQVPIALAEVVPGILLLIGVLTRISSGLLSIVMLGAIFVVKGATTFAGQGPATEFDILLLAAALMIVIMGPGRISLAHIIGRLPRPIH